MIQDCASANKIKENKYKILRMSILLGSDENKAETLNNFEDAAREIDDMNDEIYLKDLETKFYDTNTLEEEEEKLAMLVDYIGGRVEQRISLLSDFSNVTGFDLSNLPPIKYYDKLDDYKDRLKYIRQYLQNTEQIKILNEEIEHAESKLKDAYINKATSEECNKRNEEILLNKFENILRTTKELRELNKEDIVYKLNEIIGKVEESKKSLDIFNKSFATLSGSGISYEEEEEYRSYVDNAKEVYYCNKEQEYLLRIYQYLLKKETEYNTIVMKREDINELLYERINLRNGLKINDSDILSNIYELLERQYEDISRQKDNIENIENLTDEISEKKEQLNDLELDNQKVEILALLREYGLIDTYTEESSEEVPEEIEETTDPEYFEESITDEKEENNPVLSKVENPVSDEVELEEPFNIELPEPTLEPTVNIPEEISLSINPSENINITSTTNPSVNILVSSSEETVSEPPKENEIILIESASQIDLEFIHSKAEKVMQRVGEMLGIKPKDTKIVSVENKPAPPPVLEEKKEEPNFLENPLFNNDINNEEETENSSDESKTLSEEVKPSSEVPIFPSEETEMNNFWFESETPDALNELPDLAISNDNFFANNNMSDFNFPDLNLNFDANEEDKK